MSLNLLLLMIRRIMITLKDKRGQGKKKNRRENMGNERDPDQINQ